MFMFLGETASLAAALSWAGATQAYSRHAANVDALTLSLFKAAVGLFCLVAANLLDRQTPAMPIQTQVPLLASGILAFAVADPLFFCSLQRVGAQLACTLQCLVPAFAVVIAYLALGESTQPWQLAGLTVASAAVALALRPQQQAREQSKVACQAWRKGALYGLLSALLHAVSVIAARAALPRTSVAAATQLRLGGACAVLAPTCLLRRSSNESWTFLRNRRQSMWLLSAAFLGTFVAQLLYATALKHCTAGVAAALSNTYPVWLLLLAPRCEAERLPKHQRTATVLAVAGVVLTVVGG